VSGTETEGHEAIDTFRSDLRRWLAANFTDTVAASIRQPERTAALRAHRTWNAALVDAGYGAIAWPAEYGGSDADILQQLAYNEEMAAARAPGPVNAIGVANIAPAIMAYGTSDQKQRFLRPMLRGDELWSQGMSEPDSGSDLASLKCSAVRDGDDFVVNGQKTWNSNGDVADWCQLYVRTNAEAPKHQGITALLIDMTTPGVEARPIKTMAGDAGFSELFFTDARFPASALLGQVDAGWSVATNTLSHERAGVASMYLSVHQQFDDLLQAARTPGEEGARAIDSPVNRVALMRRFEETRNLEFLARRTLDAALSGQQPGAEGSVIKLAWSTTSQRLSMTAMDVLGLDALDGRWAASLLGSRSLTIAGGTTEIVKNIIGERVLGLPREPKGAA
jgi:alkylation response protein AidB-like acyl-CoA dehydrogenase